MDTIFAVSILSLAFAMTIHADQAKPADKSVKSAYSQVQKQTGSKLLTELVFPQGTSDLSADARESLRETLYGAQKQGKVAEVTIVAWADQEYPPQDVKKLSKDERRLADERLLSIKNYVTDELAGVEIKTINMAEQPDALEKAIKSSKNVKVKESLEKAGLAHPYRDGMPPKASHALVLVNLK